MKGDKIYYYDRGAFYVLSRPSACFVGIYPDKEIVTPFINLSVAGVMALSQFYSWDGPSGPTFDTPSTMRPSLYHDGTFQLFRLKLLDLKWFSKANDNLREMAIEDGMWKWRANLWHSHIVQKGMRAAATNWKEEKEKSAPQ
jgi:hypothetical protein